MRSLLSPLSRTRSATDAASPTPPASDSPPACSTPGPDPALSATPSRSSTSISSPAGETTAFHASTGEKPTPVAATKPDLLATTNSLEVPTPVASSGASDADELASKKLQIKGADKAAQCRSDEGCRSFH
ncbi:mucin-1-like [Homalodisca vitripennis]|uniref:mucin-1-like n=1 Tax=Homalodisca vitripennis TaxID=197043 RepID=UPI001EEBAFFA|nr:mucin-1-like [Homalodisca vitripennis]